MVDGTLSNCYLYDIVPLSENKAYNLFYFIHEFMSPVRTNIPDFQLDFLSIFLKPRYLQDLSMIGSFFIIVVLELYDCSCSFQIQGFSSRLKFHSDLNFKPLTSI